MYSKNLNVKILDLKTRLGLLEQGSSTPGPWPSAGPRAYQNWAAETSLRPPASPAGCVELAEGCVSILMGPPALLHCREAVLGSPPRKRQRPVTVLGTTPPRASGRSCCFLPGCGRLFPGGKGGLGRAARGAAPPLWKRIQEGGFPSAAAPEWDSPSGASIGASLLPLQQRLHCSWLPCPGALASSFSGRGNIPCHRSPACLAD